MPNPRIILEAATALSESKLGQSIAEGAETLASKLWAPSRELSALDGKSVAEQGSSSLQKIMAGYKENVPATMSSANFLQAGENQISSQLNAERSGLVAVRLQDATRGWGSNTHILLYPRIGGKPFLPPIELTTENPSLGSVADWINGRARLGAEAFPLSISKTGSAVHEMTHHEQAFLAVCRTADQFGIGSGKIGSEEAEKILAQLKAKNFAPLDKTNIETFLNHRNGRNLTAAAAERADLNIESFSNLFGRPITGNTITSRLNNISYYQGVLENETAPGEAKALLQSLANEGERLKIAKNIMPSETVEAAKGAELIGKAPTDVKEWSGAQLEDVRSTFSNFLQSLHAENSRLSRAWDVAYKNSLHEREARFNQFAATQTLRSRVAPHSGYWANGYVDLDNLVL